MFEDRDEPPRLSTFPREVSDRFHYWAVRHRMRPYATTALVLANTWVFVLMCFETNVAPLELFLTGAGLHELLIELGGLSDE